MSLPSSPNNRKEVYLSNIAGQATAIPATPQTREEQYLDYIAKNGGGGGGTGEGDMKKSVYDSDLAVSSAGGIKTYVSGAIANKVDKVEGKGLSTNDYDDSAKGVVDSVSGKATKVSSAVEGNFAALDSNGDLTDSGHKHSDYLTSHQDITGKADKVSSATEGNFAGLDSNGNLTDSGHKHSDYLTSHQDITGKADKVSGATSGNFAGLDSNGNLTDSGKQASDFATASSVSGILNGQSIDSFGDVESALEDKVDWESNTVLGAKNLFEITGTDKSEHGVTFTVNNDGSVTVNRTSSDGNKSYFNAGEFNTTDGLEYILNGCPKYTSDTTLYACWLEYVDGSGLIRNQQGQNVTDNRGNGIAFQHVTKPVRLVIMVDNNANPDNLVFKPMIRLATDTDSTYAPYAKTNRELTEDVANIPTVSVSYTGTASSTGVRKQQITVNNVSYDVDGSAYMEQSVTLSTSQATDVVFTNAIIADGAELTFSSSIWDLVPDDMVTTTGVCTVTLPKWTSAVTIGCRLRVR